MLLVDLVHDKTPARDPEWLPSSAYPFPNCYFTKKHNCVSGYRAKKIEWGGIPHDDSLGIGHITVHS